eukprot:6183514-Pleurochrysis_carterae.AAC.1
MICSRCLDARGERAAGLVVRHGMLSVSAGHMLHQEPSAFCSGCVQSCARHHTFCMQAAWALPCWKCDLKFSESGRTMAKRISCV